MIAGADPKDPTASLEPVPDYLAQMTRGLSGLTVGVDPAWALDSVDSATKAALHEAIEQIQKVGGTIREVRYPDDERPAQSWPLLCAVEAAAEHESTFPSRRDEYGGSFASVLELGGGISALDHHKRLMHREEFRGRVSALFQQVDLLLAPVTAVSGLTNEFVESCLADPEKLASLLRYTSPFDLSGHPTITLPAGRTKEGAPVAFQFVAPHFAEQLLVRAGWAYQRDTSWHRHHPSTEQLLGK